MGETPDIDALQARVRRLEAELAAIRRELEPRAGLPEGPFDALELRVGEAGWLVPIGWVREVLPRMALAPVPDAPSFVIGAFDFAGRSIPVTDLAQRLYGTPGPTGASGLVVLAAHEASALLVSAVGQIRRVAADAIDLPPGGLGVSPLLVGTVPIEGTPFSLLDVARIARGSGDA